MEVVESFSFGSICVHCKLTFRMFARTAIVCRDGHGMSCVTTSAACKLIEW